MIMSYAITKVLATVMTMENPPIHPPSNNPHVAHCGFIAITGNQGYRPPIPTRRLAVLTQNTHGLGTLPPFRH